MNMYILAHFYTLSLLKLCKLSSTKIPFLQVNSIYVYHFQTDMRLHTVVDIEESYILHFVTIHHSFFPSRFRTWSPTCHCCLRDYLSEKGKSCFRFLQGMVYSIFGKLKLERNARPGMVIQQNVAPIYLLIIQD